MTWAHVRVPCLAPGCLPLFPQAAGQATHNSPELGPAPCLQARGGGQPLDRAHTRGPVWLRPSGVASAVSLGGKVVEAAEKGVPGAGEEKLQEPRVPPGPEEWRKPALQAAGSLGTGYPLSLNPTPGCETVTVAFRWELSADGDQSSDPRGSLLQ